MESVTYSLVLQRCWKVTDPRSDRTLAVGLTHKYGSVFFLMSTNCWADHARSVQSHLGSVTTVALVGHASLRPMLWDKYRISTLQKCRISNLLKCRIYISNKCPISKFQQCRIFMSKKCRILDRIGHFLYLFLVLPGVSGYYWSWNVSLGAPKCPILGRIRHFCFFEIRHFLEVGYPTLSGSWKSDTCW